MKLIHAVLVLTALVYTERCLIDRRSSKRSRPSGTRSSSRLHRMDSALCRVASVQCQNIGLLCMHFHDDREILLHYTAEIRPDDKKVKVCFYIAQYPIRCTAQKRFTLYPLTDLFIPTPTFDISGKHSSHTAITRQDYSFT